MGKRFNMKVVVPEIVVEHYDIKKDTLLEAYYDDGYIYIEGVDMDYCEGIIDEECPHCCPCCGHCNFYD